MGTGKILSVRNSVVDPYTFQIFSSPPNSLSPVIIMACRTVEYARQKCEQYWPPDSPPSASSSPEETSSKTFDKIRIHLDSKETRRPSSEYVVRTLRIEHLDSPPGQPSRNIKQVFAARGYSLSRGITRFTCPLFHFIPLLAPRHL